MTISHLAPGQKRGIPTRVMPGLTCQSSIFWMVRIISKLSLLGGLLVCS